MNRRNFTRILAAAALAPSLSLPKAASAKLYNGPIRVVVGFPPGGATDVVARTILDRLSQALGGQVFMVDNRAGAGGQIAAQFLKAAPADGSTIMLSIDHTQVIIPLTISAAGYNPVTDFTALAGVASYYNVLAVSSAIGVKNMAELGTWVKAHPNEANYGIPAVGSVPQFIGHIVGKAFGVTMNSVPYKGGAPMVQDVLGGRVPMGVSSMTDFIEYHRAGKVQIVATSGEVRNRIAPEIPTFKELGFVGIDKNPWLAFFGPKGMSSDFVAQFDVAVKEVLVQQDLQDKLSKLGNEANPAPAREVQQWVVDANRHWGQVIKDSGFKPQ
jgi:tripartite-type tricarboxylate transporter receptor subunit TctC